MILNLWAKKDTQESNKRILFIHIPKNAGTSVNHVLSSNGKNLWKRVDDFNYHDPYFLLQKNNPEIILTDPFIFSIVRNPFTRIFSCFKHFNVMNHQNISFDEYLELCKNKKNNVKDGDIPFWKTPMIFYPQSLFLYDSGGYLLKENIYRFENISPLERKISELIGRNIKFPMLNMNGNSGYYESYTSENIEIVKDLFSIDFDNFKYSTNFEESNE